MTPLIVKILAGVIPGLVVLLFPTILFFLWWRRCRTQQQRATSVNVVMAAVPPSPREDGIQAAIDKFHHLHPHQRQKPNAQHQPPLNWDAHLKKISEAIDHHGWSQFVFADRSSVPRSSPLWSLCATGDAISSQEPQQMKPESMQSVRISPARPKKSSSGGGGCSNSPLYAIDSLATTTTTTTTCTRMSLPLPGPPSLIGSSFPQEAYFEITIMGLNCASGPKKRLKDGAAASDGDDDDDDRLKLIKQNHRKVQSEGETRTRGPPTEKHKPDSSLICLGLTRGGSTETKLIPGTYPGSIGFQSNGSVCLDGIKLVSESNRMEWAAVDRVVGCGFSPSKKKVFFTVDSELVHVIRCHSEAYKSPLYPILSANSEVTVQVNLGQAAFEYVPANAHRTANPCFLPTTPGAYEDSREFFSIRMPDTTERFDLAASAKSPGITNIKKSSKSGHNWDGDSVIADVDKEFELFEIALNY